MADISQIAAGLAEEVRPGSVVGLGTGRAASAFVRALAKTAPGRERALQCLPTSRATEALAR